MPKNHPPLLGMSFFKVVSSPLPQNDSLPLNINSTSVIMPESPLFPCRFGKSCAQMNRMQSVEGIDSEY